MEIEEAIILQRGMADGKVVLLGRTSGRVSGYLFAGTPLLGSVVRCRIVATRRWYRFEDVELIELPLCLARGDLLFLHHVLELCFSFVPEGSRAPELFDLVRVLYRQRTELLTTHCKKLFLCRLLMQIGLYDQLPGIGGSALARLLDTPVDMAAWGTIDLDCQRELDAWLLRCVASHPLVESFNTMHFLTGRRNRS